MVGFVHFSNFLIPSEKYYNLQSYWITLYTVVLHGYTRVSCLPITITYSSRLIYSYDHRPPKCSKTFIFTFMTKSFCLLQVKLLTNHFNFKLKLEVCSIPQLEPVY